MTETRLAEPRVVKPFKDNVPVGGLAFGCVFNSVFLFQALMDLSADWWVAEDPQQRLPFLLGYYSWRGSEPIITILMIPILVMLPLIMFAMISAAAQSILGSRRARLITHIADCAEAITICSVLTIAITQAAPMQGALHTPEVCGVKWTPPNDNQNQTEPSAPACLETLVAFTQIHVILVFFNLVMFCCPFLKYFYGTVPEAEWQAQAELHAAQSAPKDEKKQD